MTVHGEWVSWAWVSVVSGTAGDENIALGAAVTASGPVWQGFLPTNLTDGNRQTMSHPLTPVRSFNYLIDLGAEFALDHINVFNRGDGCCPDRLTNYRVSIHDDDEGSVGPAVWSADIRTDGSNSGVGGTDVLTADLDSAGSFQGQYIQIEKIDDGSQNYWPQIAEVEVFGVEGYDQFIQTDVETEMLQVTASAYVRVPFIVTAGQ